MRIPFIISLLFVFVYQSNSQSPIVCQKVSSPDFKRGEYFGYALSVLDSYIFVGTNDLSSGSAQTSEEGTVYVLKKDSLNYWKVHQRLRSPEKHDYDRFAERVYSDGNTLLISAYQHETDANGLSVMDDAGAVFVYELEENDLWKFKQKIVADDRSAFDQFGIRTALKGNVMIIGANGDKAGVPGYTDRNSIAGSAYIFKRDSKGIWAQFQKIVPSDGAHRASFGASLAFSGEYIVIGAPGDSWINKSRKSVNPGGAAYIFKEDPAGQWIETQKLYGHKRNILDRFGWGIGISDSSLLIGASLEEVVNQKGETLKDAGAVYSYSLSSNGHWDQVDRITACDPSAEAAFGHSVSLYNDKAIIGAPHRSGFGKRMIGAAYFYKLNYSDYWQQTSKVLEDKPEKDYRFGSVSTLSANYFIISAHRSGSSKGNGPTHKKWGEVFILNSFPEHNRCAAEKLSTY